MEETSVSQMANSERADMGYPTQVWFMDIFVVSPIIIIIVASLADSSYLLHKESWQFIFILVGISFFLSLPTLAATYITFFLSIRMNVSRPIVQVLCCIVANVGVGVTYGLLGLSMQEAVLKWYFVATNISFLIMNLNLNQYLKRWLRV